MLSVTVLLPPCSEMPSMLLLCKYEPSFTVIALFFLPGFFTEFLFLVEAGVFFLAAKAGENTVIMSKIKFLLLVVPSKTTFKMAKAW